MDDIKYIKELFKNTPQSYKSIPFWSWNDDLKPGELARQVKDMKEHGMGGFFMHCREGLETKYLDEEFMECVKETVKAAEQNGMHAWLYDEDRYSSGMGGGLVTKRGGDEVRAKALTIEITKEKYTYEDNVVALFKAKTDYINILELERLDAKKNGSPDDGQVFLIFRKAISNPNEWCQNDTYVDMLNPETIKVFIDTTYEKYKEYVGDEFGKTIPGIFTDEPNVSGFNAKSDEMAWLPWSDSFVEFFIKKRGYDFLDYVPYMFFDGDRSFKTRHDFWRTITERFCEVFSKTISGWCESNGLKFTGHFHSESCMAAAARTSGAVMPHYRYFHVPGVDTLCEQTAESITMKQCSSVANQYGRKRVITETFGVTGWDFTFEGMKWMVDWQYALGVNQLCQHLAQYSLKGCRKRDYPPSFNYNNCWWKYYSIIEGYSSRLGTVLSQGNAIRDILIIHPSSTVWGMLGIELKEEPYSNKINSEEAENYSENFNCFINAMLSGHYDFDLGDETIIEEQGRVENGKFHINLASYSVVVVPPIKTLFESTFRLLKEFLDTGGKVVLVGHVPAMIEGKASDKLSELCKYNNFYTVKESEEVCKTLESFTPRKVSIRNKAACESEVFLYMLKELADGRILFVVNNDRKNSHDVSINVSGNGKIEEWDLLTATVKEINASVSEEKISFTDSFKPAASKLYVINNNEKSQLIIQDDKNLWSNYKFLYKDKSIVTALGPVCKISRTMPNALVLDRCAFRIDNGEWSEKLDVWKAQKEIRDALGMKQVFYNGILQRHHWVDIPHPRDGAYVEFKFTVNIVDMPEKEVFLALEGAKYFAIKVNGRDAENKIDSWYMDRSIEKIKLEYLKPGINEIVLSCNYLNRMEVEDCFIIGDFGVDTGRNIVKEPETMRFGDWCLQGYLHYCGSLVYHFDFEYEGKADDKLMLELGEYSAVTVEVRVNGNTAGHIPWKAANELDITGFLKQGNNKIDIEVMGSPRNLFGPLHQAATEYNWLEWWSFRREGAEYTQEYVTRPYGLMGQVHLYRQK